MSFLFRIFFVNSSFDIFFRIVTLCRFKILFKHARILRLGPNTKKKISIVRTQY